MLIEFANVYSRKLKVAWPTVETALHELGRNFAVYQTTPATVAHATRLAGRYSLSWFDALIAAAALECGCDTLHSEDLQTGLVLENTLTVVNPFAV